MDAQGGDSVGQGPERLLRLLSGEGGKPLKPAELKRVKQNLDLFDFLTPHDCRALIVAVEQLQGELRDIDLPPRTSPLSKSDPEPFRATHRQGR